MAKSNGNGSAPTIENPSQVLKRSVTVDDIAKYTGHGVINLLIPAFSLGTYEIYGLPPELPPIAATAPWSKARDLVLAATLKAEGKWAGVVNLFCNKIVARGRVIESPVSRRIDNVNQILDLCNGYEGFESFLEKGCTAFLTSSQIGMAVEIVRTSRSPGAKIITLNVLDPLRCWRTGDPSTPIIYWDLMGVYHELKSWECFVITDQPQPRAGWWWGGTCASERAYRDIRKVAAMTQLFDEKITGSGYTSLVFIPGIATVEQIKEAKDQATAEQLAKGIVYYQGKLLIPFYGDKDALDKVVEIQMKNLPEGWDREKELEFCEIQYALATGIPFTEINPRLSAHGALGVGAQSQIIDDAQRGMLSATFVKRLTNQLNRLVTPQATTILLESNDLRDEKMEAEIGLVRAQTRAVMRGNLNAPGELTAKQSLYLAIQSDDAPREFINAQTPVDETLTDEEKPLSESDRAALESANAQESAQESAPEEEAQTIQVKEIKHGHFVSRDGQSPAWVDYETVKVKEVSQAPGLHHATQEEMARKEYCETCIYARDFANVTWYCRPYDFPTKEDWLCNTWERTQQIDDQPPAQVKELKESIQAQIEAARELYRKAREKAI